MKNPVVYWELASHDAASSVAFLSQLLGWEFTYDEQTTIYDLPAGGVSGDFAGGGVFTLKKARLPFLTIYIRVDDIEAKARRVEELGGLITVPITEIPGGSRICLFNEPSGVTLAMLERGKAPSA